MRTTKVLVVEDKVIAQRVARNILSGLGCEVEVAATGYSALEMVAKHGEYDLIFMDIGLPDIDGITVSQKIKLINEAQAIVALTAHNDATFRQQCNEVGMAGYMLKPITTELCREILTKLELIHEC